MLNRLRTGLVLLFMLVLPLVSAYAGGITADPVTSELKVLAIGNSFSVDAMQHLYQIAADAGVKKIVLGNLYIGGCSLSTHYTNAKGNVARYTYYKNTNGTWTTKASQTMMYGLKDEDWDIITIQQASGVSGVLSSYLEGDVLPYLIKYVHDNKTNPNAKLAWHMTWAYQQDSNHAAFATYNRNQMDMYRAIVNAVQEAIVPNKGFDFVIPSGTAIQNMRGSYVGDTLTRDGYHLSHNLGRYVAGVTWLHAITGWPIDNLSWVPSTTDIPDVYLPIVKEAVQAAVRQLFAVTPSSYATKWFISPLPEAVDKAEIPVQIKSPSFPVQRVKIDLDGRTLYGAANMPTDLVIKTAALAHGKHLLEGTLTDTTGQTHSEIIEFSVEHYQLLLGDGEYSTRVSGVIPMDFVSIIRPEEYQSVVIQLVPIVEGVRGEPQELYTGSILPQGFVIDTRTIADGPYDLDLSTTTTAGVKHHRVDRIVVKNWHVIADAIEPPSVSTWFGSFDRLMTVNRSEGWEFTAQDAQTFFGDNSRIRPSTQAREYLTWELAQLHRFEFTFYAQPEYLGSIVQVLVSSDAQTWTAPPYSAQVQEKQLNGPAKVLVTGQVPPAQNANFVRLVVDTTTAQSNAVELGHVLLHAPVE